jgi:hypothetical protein
LGVSRSASGLGSSGAFRFLRKQLDRFEASFSRASDELAFNKIKRSVGLMGLDDTQTDGPSCQIGELQTCGICFLVCKHNLKIAELLSKGIVATGNSSEFEFEVGVFFGAPSLKNEMRSPLTLSKMLKMFKNAFDAKSERYVVWIVVKQIFVAQTPFVDYCGYDFNASAS